VANHSRDPWPRAYLIISLHEGPNTLGEQGHGAHATVGNTNAQDLSQGLSTIRIRWALRNAHAALLTAFEGRLQSRTTVHLQTVTYMRSCCGTRGCLGPGS
jgi:hypothetical protein